MTRNTRIALQQLDTERHIASQARREATRAQLLANTLERAGELAQQARLAESKRVIALNYFAEED